jgi:hypothetical protein
MELNYKYIGLDQYGNKVLIERYPRKELMEWAGKSSASKMYISSKAGLTFHVGYIVGSHWFYVWGLEGSKFIKQV